MLFILSISSEFGSEQINAYKRHIKPAAMRTLPVEYRNKQDYENESANAVVTRMKCLTETMSIVNY